MVHCSVSVPENTGVCAVITNTNETGVKLNLESCVLLRLAVLRSGLRLEKNCLFKTMDTGRAARKGS